MNSEKQLNELEQEIKSAFREMPKAQENKQFRSRLLAVAALTPQVGPVAVLQQEAGVGMVMLLRGGVAALGFALGASILLFTLTFSPTMNSQSRVHQNNSTVVALLPVLSVDPVETYTRTLVSEQEPTP